MLSLGVLAELDEHVYVHIYTYICMHVCKKMGNLPYEIVVIKQKVICFLGFEELVGERNSSGGLVARTVVLPLNLLKITENHTQFATVMPVGGLFSERAKTNVLTSYGKKTALIQFRFRH